MRGIDHKALGRFLLESGYIAPSISPLCRRMFLFGCIEPDINPLTYTRGSLRHRFLHGHNAANAKRHLRRIIRRMCRKGVHSPIQWFVFGAALDLIYALPWAAVAAVVIALARRWVRKKKKQ